MSLALPDARFVAGIDWAAAEHAVCVLDESGKVMASFAIRHDADGHREILGIEVASSEDGAGWLAFLRGLVARGLSGVQLVTSDCPQGLRDAIAATLPGATWQRCRTHYADLGIMPTWRREPLVVPALMLKRSA